MKKTPAKPKRIRYTVATGNSLLRAYSRAFKNFTDDTKFGGIPLIASETSAGFIITPGKRGEPKEGFQVFVRVCRYNESLLNRDTMSGGLLINTCPTPAPKKRKDKKSTPGFVGAPM